MKTIILKISAFLLLFCLMGTGCEKDDKPCACGVENPIENLDWLKQIFDSGVRPFKVYSFTSNGNEFILTEDSLGNARMTFYNCDGELKCDVGGAAGVGGNCDLPTGYWSDFEKNKKLIYPHEFN